MNIMIIKSPNDKREYQHIRLPNDLDVILVKDVNTKVSAASLKICVGMLDDPRETQGIAHFLEHMLFMGSQKYPSQNEYSQYIQQNAGSTNASTSLQGTQYYFSIASDAFEKGLDIFAQFFIAPLFIQDCVEREMQAVESEFQLSLADDDQRLWEIFRMQTDQNSSFNTFGCGNLKTLSKPTIRDDLIQFYQKYYSANLMKLVIYHNQDTQQLVQQIFSEIPNNRFPKPQHLDNPFNKYKQLIEIQGIKQEDQLYVSFIQKNYKSYYKYKPQEYITHLLGTEGRNSLVSFLLDEGLITELTCGTQEINDATSELYIQIVLTEDGRIECDQVLAHLFKYIQLIKEQGVQQWIFDEIRIIEEIKFQYKEKSNPEGYVGQLSSKMHKYPIEDVIYGPYQYEKFDALLIQEVLDQININNANIYVKGNEFEKSKLKWEVEPWCQTKYRKSDFSKDLQNIWNNCQNAKGKLTDKIIGIPFKNPYIPQTFDIYPGTQKYPELLVDNEFQKLYFLHDSKFQICKTCVGIVIYPNQEFVVDPKQRKLADLWGEALSHYFNEQSYEAESASVELSITMGYNKIIIEIKGFSDSVSRFTQDFIQYLNNFENLPIKEHIFEVLLDDLDDRYENYFLKSPYDLVFSYLKCNLYEKGKFMKEQLKDIDITFSEFNKFKQTFLNQVFMDIYVHGNILPQQAINLIQLKRQQNKQIQPLRILHIDNNKIFKTILDNPDEPNAGLITYIQGDHTKDPVVDLQYELLNQLISDPAENQLRTNEQLGYVAYTQKMNRRGTIGLLFVIVSQVKTPDYLSTRVKSFINQYIGEIQNLSQEEFNKAKQALIQRKEQDYESTVRQFQTFFSEIKNHTYDFQQKDLVRQRLESINYGDFINFVIGFLQKPSLEIQIINPKMEQQVSTGKINENYLDDLFGY